jgi:hypothetical protein
MDRRGAEEKLRKWKVGKLYSVLVLPGNMVLEIDCLLDTICVLLSCFSALVQVAEAGLPTGP